MKSSLEIAQEAQILPIETIAERIGFPLLVKAAAGGERLAAPLGERLGRAEAPARAADEQDARQARIRHGSL